jgi:dTDP-4-dehydrorhamnose reductase
VTRLLVTGASGLLGGRLAALLASDFEVAAARHVSPVPAGRDEVALDLTSAASVAAAFETARPDAVVHSAALADADRCEREPALAAAVNVEGTARLADACARRGIRLVLISTDLVLSGEKALWREEDEARPLQEYGRSKRAAERETLARGAGNAVVRVALVHGRGFGPRGTATESLRWALAARRPLRLFTDQFRTPVDAASVAAALAALVRGRGEGLYHLGGPERLSRYELGLRVARALGLPAAVIEGLAQDEVAATAARPKDVSLDIGRARRELGFEPLAVDEAIRAGRPNPAAL